MAVALVGTLVGALLDYFNPKTRVMDWLAAWCYSAAALAWAEILGVQAVADKITNEYLRWSLFQLGAFLTLMLANSMITWKVFIFRKILTPVSDRITGLGAAAHQGFNGQLIGVIAAAVALVLLTPHAGKLPALVDSSHVPVRAAGNWVAQEVGIGWLGFPGSGEPAKAATSRG